MMLPATLFGNICHSSRTVFHYVRKGLTVFVFLKGGYRSERIYNNSKPCEVQSKKIFGEVGRIMNGSTAYIDLEGGGPLEWFRKCSEMKTIVI